MYEIIFLDETGEEDRNTFNTKETLYWAISALKLNNVNIISSGKASDTGRISPDDIGNDIHEFLHGGDK